MSKVKLAALGSVAALIIVVSGLEPDQGPFDGMVGEVLGSTEVSADTSDRRQTRRVVRRTMRRIDRRQDRREALDDDCVAVIISNVTYWRCDSIYYQEIIEDGVTVFVVVNP